MKTEVLRRCFGTESFSAEEAGFAWNIRKPYSTLSRLKQQGVIESVRRGQYRISADEKIWAVNDAAEKLAMQALRAKRDGELSQLAKLRWDAWLKEGYVQQTGPRAYVVTPRTGGRRANVQRIS